MRYAICCTLAVIAAACAGPRGTIPAAGPVAGADTAAGAAPSASDHGPSGDVREARMPGPTGPATDVAAQEEDEAPAYLVILKRDPTWEVIPRALLPPGAQGGYWHEGTKGRVFFYLVPLGKGGVSGAVRDTHAELQEAALATEPVREGEDGSWAWFLLSGEFPSGDPARGKVFARRLETMPGFMIMAIGLWPAEHDAPMRGELDYMVATAHMRRMSTPSED